MLQKQHILIAILLFVPFLGGGLGVSATTLGTFLANLEQQTLQSDFTITVSEEVAQPMNYPGTITMRGNRF